MPTFKDYQERLAPPWLRQPKGAAWMRGLGDQKDELEQRAREAVYARCASVAAPDALTQVGGERGIEKGVSETVAAYRASVAAAWQLWPAAGTALGVLRALYKAGYPAAAMTLWTATGRSYNYDAVGDTVIILDGPAFTFADPHWNVFKLLLRAWLITGWSPPPASNSATADNVRRLLGKWKPAHAKCDGIVVWESGFLWGAGDNWAGVGLNWGGVATTWTY